MSGLSAAQYALSTVSNNITNFQVAGYNRQNTIFAQNGGTLSPAGFIGNGVAEPVLTVNITPLLPTNYVLHKPRAAG